MVDALNQLQSRFRRPVEVLYLDDDQLEFRCPWWAGGRQFVVQTTESGLSEVSEVIDGLPVQNAAAERVDFLLRDYVRTERGNMVPRSRLAECEAAGH